MTTFIKGESLIAYSLLHRSSISFSELRQISKLLREMFNKLNVDAVIIDYDLKEVIDYNSDCFKFIEVNGYSYIERKIGKEELQKRFISYLPIDVLKIML